MGRVKRNRKRLFHMKISVQRIESPAQAAAAVEIRRNVFGRELHCRIANPIEESRPSLHLLARVQPAGDSIAALSVVDTTGDTGLHDGFRLPFGGRARVARYTQLAVLKPYRGCHIPLRMILEAHWRFVVPGGFEHTWLLFHADRAGDSSLCRLLGFRACADTFETEYGRVRALVREEHSVPVETGRHPSTAPGDPRPLPEKAYEPTREWSELSAVAAAATYSTNRPASYPVTNAGMHFSR